MHRLKLEVTIQDREVYSLIRNSLSLYLQQVMKHSATLMEIALNEAVNNAFMHGISARRRPGPVRIKLYVLGKRLIIRICDDGYGFKANEMLCAYTQTELEPEMMRETGRGMWIMHRIADSLIFNRQGNELLMVKRID